MDICGTTFCHSSDIEQRFFDFLEDFNLFQIQSHFVHINELALTRETKRPHEITGWASICEVRRDKFGRPSFFPLLDVWCGFEWKWEEKIRCALKGMCFDHSLIAEGIS